LFRIRPDTRAGEFTARGGASGGTGSLARIDVAVGDAFIQVYRVSKGSEARLAIDAVGRGDELAFTYVDGVDKKRPMIFAIDESKRVYWLHPASTSGADDPVATTDRAGPEPRELRRPFAHRFAGTRLDVHAVFLDEPVTVRQMDS